MNRLVLFGLAAVMVVVGCSKDTGTSPSTVNVPFSTTDLRVGTGAEAVNGKTVSVNYSGWVYNAQGVDNKGASIGSGTLPPFVVGSTQTIAGFNQGVTGMRAGGQRRIVVPPTLGYGANPPPGSGIPANATLIFEVELVAVQ